MPQHWFGHYSTVHCSSTLHGQEHNHWHQLCQEKIPFSHFDATKIQQLQSNLQHCHIQSTNGLDKDISHLITIYRDVVDTIKQNCRMHLYNVVCKRCKDVNWLLEGGKSLSPWAIYGGYFAQNRTWYTKMTEYGISPIHTTSYVSIIHHEQYLGK